MMFFSCFIIFCITRISGTKLRKFINLINFINYFVTFACRICADMFITEKDYLGFKAGREKSFERIFLQYYRTLVSFVEREGLNRMEAEDIVIEVLHRMWEIRKEILSPAALHSLLFTAVRNKALNYLRDAGNQKRILRENYVEREEEDFYDHVMDAEMCRLLNEAIAKLPSRSRQVILLSLEGKSMEEIAKLLSISVNSVRTYKFRAINSLRESLRDYPLLLAFLFIFSL